jgi:hypothetical protein
LIGPIKCFQNTSANELVVSIKSHDYAIAGTVVNGGKIDILKSRHPSSVLYISIVLPINLVKFEVVSVDLPTSVRGRIINNYYFVIGVVLKENRIQVILNSKIFEVIV